MTTVFDDRQYTILLVEDDPVNIGIILECLSPYYQLFIAKTRAKAFQVLEKERIDIVLLDINLPDGNGFDICRELIDNQHDYGPLSIVFMTGMDNPEDEAKGIELGGRDYITKPINSTVMKARIDLQAQLLRQTELLSNLARIDGTTEVNNRRAFDDQLQSEWNRALREQQPLTLCMLDIDFFKQFNDTYGHPAGDQCLRSLAKLLVSHFRRSSDFVARYGGEEFAIILSNTELSIADMLVKRVLQAFHDLHIQHSGSDVSNYTSFSAGVCTTIPTTNSSFDALLHNADELLYQAKHAGRARVEAQSL